MPTHYYPFAQTADRLIQVAVRQDGKVQITERSRRADGTWPASKPIPSGFYAPTDATLPIKVTLSVDNSSWGLVCKVPPEWDDYRISSVNILGRPGPHADQIAPSELDYGGGYQNPNPNTYSRSLVITAQGPYVLFFDPSAPSGAEETTLDTSKWYSQSSGQARACFVLQVCGNNHGTVVLENVSTGGATTFTL